MPRTYIAAGNWKMHKTVNEGIDTALAVAEKAHFPDIEVVIGPTFLHLPPLNRRLKDSNVKLAAQNCNENVKGAFTGEVSPAALAELGIEYVILGHSERREIYHETNELIRSKIDAALAQGLKVIFCCGEPLNIREHSTQAIYVQNQLENCLFHLNKEQLQHVTIAYEPIWAIGTGQTATPDQAQEMHAYIRELISKHFDGEAADNLTILYGGSVKPNNSRELFSQPDVDGGLVGGASLDYESFLQIASALQTEKGKSA